jgi:hypothetical protein
VRIVVPFVDGMLCDETVDALTRSTFTWEPVKLPMLDDEAYGRAFRGWWSDGQAFCVVEHDNVPTFEQLAGLARCDELRCAVPYQYMGKVITTGLGCTRFSQELLREFPHAADRAMEMGATHQYPAKWFQVDAGINNYLTIVGRAVHVHDGLCEHLHTWPALEDAGYIRGGE